MNNITLVSAYYEIKSKRPKEAYIEWMKNFFQLTCPKVVFTDEETLPLLLEYNANPHTTKYYILAIADFATSRYDNSWHRQLMKDPEKYHTIELYKLWNEKTNFLKLTIEWNPFGTEYFIWCDIGYFRDKERMVEFANWPCSWNIESVLFLEIEPFTEQEKMRVAIPDHRFLYANRIGGGIIAGNKRNLLKWHSIFFEMLERFIANDVFAGKDQSIYAFCILNNPTLCKVVQRPKKYDYDGWFYLKDYLNVKPNIKVSVIMPIFNGIEFFAESLSSIVKQTCQVHEILIGINGHQRNGEVYRKIIEVIDNVANSHSNIRVYQYDEANKVNTSNELVKLAEGSHIALLDVDDSWLPEKIEKQLEILNQHGYSVIGTLCSYYHGGRPNIPSGCLDTLEFAKHNMIINSSCLVKKELAWWNPDFKNGLEDYELWLRLALSGCEFYNVPSVLVKHRVYQGSFYNSRIPDSRAQELREQYFKMK